MGGLSMLSRVRSNAMWRNGRIAASRRFSTGASVTRVVRFLDENGRVRYGMPVVGEGKDTAKAFAYTPDELQRRSMSHAYILDEPDDGFAKRQSRPDNVVGLSSPRDSMLTRLGLPLFTKLARAWGTQDTPIPVKITKLLWAIGVNYIDAFTELGLEAGAFKYPVVFMQNAAAVNNPFDPIVIPSVARGECDYEVELAVIIGVDMHGKLCKNVSPHEALEYVLGFTCANDIGARKWQGKKGGGQWTRGKSFDTFLPLGPCLVSPKEIKDPQKLRMVTRLNGDVMQDCNTDNMVWSVAKIISFLSQETTLLPGSVILTGTPPGIGFVRTPPRYLRNGDKVSVEIEGIGALYNTVVEN